MARRTLTIGVLLMVCAVCAAPALAWEADGAEQTRMSEVYVFKASFTVDPYTNVYSWNSLAMIDGSENDRIMQEYLADPDDMSLHVAEDDSAEIASSSVPLDVNVYYFTTIASDNMVYYGSMSKRGELVLEPYNEDRLTFFVKAGDTFTIDITATDNQGGSATPRLYTGSGYLEISSGHLSRTFTSSTSLMVTFVYSSTALYYDVTYAVDGSSSPNGSPATYIAVCAVVTVLILLLLVYAGMRPKWSK